MGHMQHKYTRTYFTKTNPDGSVAGYGAEGYAEFMEGKIRETDLSILSRLDFSGRLVLEFGFGRGEAIKYVLEHGAASYEGVDFSEHAIAIATEFLEKFGLTVPSLHHADALAFLKEYMPIHEAQKRPAFDIVLMLDFVEHVPRAELLELMKLLRGILSDTAVVVINTPVFRVDNDVVRDGLSPLNNEDTIDKSDLIEETAGMHCNKYTSISLQEFMRSCDFAAISEAHFYIPAHAAPTKIRAIPAFRMAWQDAAAKGYPISPEWKEDVIEYAYQRPEIPSWHTFNVGRLSGISLLMADFYKQFFPSGEYDAELFEDLGGLTAEGKTIFDLGGFMGVSSLLFARLVGTSGRVLCFEPNPWNQQRIRTNLSRNPKLARSISLYGMALGDSVGKMEMLLSDNVDTGYSSTSQSVSSHGTLPKDHLISLGFYHRTVTLVTLDAFVKETGIIPDILKVDIEGAEHFFLTGAEETIANHRPIIYMEVHSPFCAWQCSQKLQRMGYVSRLLFEESDGRIMIRAEHQDTTVALVDSPGMSRELLDLLRLEQQRQIRSTESLLKTQNAFQNIQHILQGTQHELQIAELELHGTKDELISTKNALTSAMKIVNHPYVRIPVSILRFIKKLSQSRNK